MQGLRFYNSDRVSGFTAYAGFFSQVAILSYDGLTTIEGGPVVRKYIDVQGVTFCIASSGVGSVCRSDQGEEQVPPLEVLLTSWQLYLSPS